MGFEENEFQTRLQLISQLNLQLVMDQARHDREVMSRVIAVLEERAENERTGEENAILEWARAFQRLE